MATPSRSVDLHEWNQLLFRLERSFTVFSTLYSISRPIFTDKLPTAAVLFNKAGNCIDFWINPQFWDTLSFEQKEFVMCHEAMHVFLNHGVRFRSIQPWDRPSANLAMDVVINHLLVDKLDFNRKRIDPPRPPEHPNGVNCWRNTVFKGPHLRRAKPNQSFEFYLNLLKQQQKANGEEPQVILINDHSNLDSFLDKEGKGLSKPMKDLLKRAFNHGQLKELADFCKEAGVDAGDLTKVINEITIVPKRKWETIIKDWASQFHAEYFADQFVRTNRRYAMLQNDETFLPTEMEVQGYDKNRVDVWFFLDTSGSCSHLGERFFKAALSLPPERFNVRLFCFDTKVYDVDPVKRELFGFGGTCFQCIDARVRQETNFATMGQRAPQVWVLTDGYGSKVTPERPDKWQWFLTDDYRECIPKESRVHMLKDFE